MAKEVILMLFLNLLVLAILSSLPTSSAAPRWEIVQPMCSNNIVQNASLYVPNFVATMENISLQVRKSGFGLAVTGSGPLTNYGLAQCYGDLSPTDCVLCYAAARSALPQCFPSLGGRIYLDGCFMRDENYDFFQEYAGPNDHALCENRTVDDSAFRDAARRALSRAVLKAPGNDGYARVETKKMTVASRNESVYVLANCWKNLNASACSACLRNAFASLLGCLPRSGGRAVNVGCFVRYSDINFLNPVLAKGRGSRAKIVTAVVVSSAAVLIIGAAIGLYVWKQCAIQTKRRGSGDVEKLEKELTKSGLNFKYSVLEMATSSFDGSNKLGQGEFGTMYKGLLQDGRDIAVKRLFFNNKHRAKDFYKEVKIVSGVEHKNLIRLLGCSCSGPETLLVYEFLPNKSLDCYIFDAIKGKALNWGKRFEIIIGTAEGLVYLHENTKAQIIHRNVKASNILLDSRFRPKIADFGLVRSDKSHIITVIAGTLGYMAPEYFAHGQLTEKVDVYSFGVLVLEIVSGKKSSQSKNTEYGDSLITTAWKHFQLGTIEEIIDPNLTAHNYRNMKVEDEILRAFHVGLLCTQEISSLRPSMSRALQMLANKEVQLPAPSNPPFLDESTMELHGIAQNYKASPDEQGNMASNQLQLTSDLRI
ncbi:cysteine-rich receptor-like protein kinase 2 [Andrographis paniculata]|uniref:cysteine-rich receptor-like protein kinase 2 n=1 Tax=Andrographis paniculata TaxID=175694 RepID=UPI0021E7667E|nr:cysteine-rich receptor-like protein kinase 2 [Andrographis paniculata]